MHTEDQAKELWCPAVRHTTFHSEENVTDPACNRHDSYYSPEYAHCIASQCMWWRGMWRKKVTARTYWDKEELASKPTAPGKEWERVGYCGQAGAPR